MAQLSCWKESRMTDINRQAEARWKGNLTEGGGTLSLGTGILRDAAITWRARTEDGQPTTSPEELIAAAHASCYAMALSNTLSENGHSPEQLDVTSEVTASLTPDGLSVVRSALRVRGRVPGLGQAEFEELARKGEQGCPVSNALRGSLEITLDATLES
jgi:osmotically inducible protein OsmC